MSAQPVILLAPPKAEPRFEPDPDQIASKRLWAAFMIALDVDTLVSILDGKPVPAWNLDATVLRRALRGGPLPDPDSWFRVRHGHLDAVAEAGPLVSRDTR